MTMTVLGQNTDRGYFNDNSFAESFSFLISILMLLTFIFIGILRLIALAREHKKTKVGILHTMPAKYRK